MLLMIMYSIRNLSSFDLNTHERQRYEGSGGGGGDTGGVDAVNDGVGFVADDS